MQISDGAQSRHDLRLCPRLDGRPRRNRTGAPVEGGRMRKGVPRENHHLAQRRITYLLRRALGDLFLGPYSVYFGLQAPSSLLAAGPPRMSHWPLMAASPD